MVGSWNCGLGLQLYRTKEMAGNGLGLCKTREPCRAFLAFRIRVSGVDGDLTGGRVFVQR